MKKTYQIIKKEIYSNNKRIHGELYLPQNDNYDLMIFSHGLGGSLEGSRDIAQKLYENDIASFIFDFCGGSYESKSSGTVKEMSVLSEADDLNTVIDELKKDKKINRLYLTGKSQGAFVSTLVASKRPQDIDGIIGLYPAFILYDGMKKEMEKYDSIPEEFEFLDLNLSDKYIKDLLATDIYKLCPMYPGKVLLIHGEKDKLVTLESVEKARNCFPDCKLITLKDAEHGFHGPERTEVIRLILEFCA